MKLDHVAIIVNNIDESVLWYEKNLDAVRLYSDESWGVVRVGDTKIALVILNTHPSHIGFKVESPDEFPCKNEEIKSHRDGSRYHYKSDPSGNVIEWIFWPDLGD